MRINCHLPITVRIVGVPTDDQLAALGAALTRAVVARLAEAEQVLCERHGLAGRGPVEVRERYDPSRQGTDAYAIPSYGDGGRKKKLPTTDRAPAKKAASETTSKSKRGPRKAAPPMPAEPPVPAGPPAPPAGPPAPAGPRPGRPDIRKLRREMKKDKNKEAAERLFDWYSRQSDAYLRQRIRAGDEMAKAAFDQRVPSNEATLKRILGNDYRPPHEADVRLLRRGVEVWNVHLRSGNMTPAENALGYPDNSLATHTEARAVNRAPWQRGDVMFIDGQYDPCGSCQEAMRAAAARHGVIIVYSWLGGRMRFSPPGATQVPEVPPPTSPPPGRPPTPSAATPPSTAKRVVAGAAGAILALNELLGGYNRAKASAQAGIDLGRAEIAFWEWAGANPVPAVWDSWGKVALPKDTPTEATAMGSQRRPFVVDIDVNALRHNLPGKINSYEEFVHFLGAARELDTIEESPRIPDRPDAAQRLLAENVRYRVTVNKENIAHKKVYDITDIMAPLRLAMLAKLDAAMRAQAGQLSVAQRHQIFRLKFGPETKLYRSRGGSFNDQPLLSTQRTFGPDPWVRLVSTEPTYFRRIKVTPVNADAGRGRITMYRIRRWIVDVEKEVKEHGRPILSRNEVNGVLESFVAGPQPDDPRFGNTRYIRHDDETSRHTMAIGELNIFWVDRDDLTQVPDGEVEQYLKAGGGG